MQAGRSIAGDQAGAVTIGQHRPAQPPGSLEQPLRPVLVRSERAIGVGDHGSRHLVDELLLVLEVPVEGRSLHAQGVGQPPGGQAVQACLVQQLQRSAHDHGALKAHAVPALSTNPD